MRAAQALLRGPAARAAGIYYLEHESVEFTTSHGHRWKVYGSPVSLLQQSLLAAADQNRLLLYIPKARFNIDEEQKPEVRFHDRLLEYKPVMVVLSRSKSCTSVFLKIRIFFSLIHPHTKYMTSQGGANMPVARIWQRNSNSLSLALPSHPSPALPTFLMMDINRTSHWDLGTANYMFLGIYTRRMVPVSKPWSMENVCKSMLPWHRLASPLLLISL